MEPHFFLWCTAESKCCCLTISLLLGCPFPGPLFTESRHLMGIFWSVSVGVSRLLTSQVYSLDTWGKMKTQGLTTMSFFRLWGHWSVLSPTFRHSLCLFDIWCSVLWAVVSRKNREKNIYFIFWLYLLCDIRNVQFQNPLIHCGCNMMIL